MSAALPPRASAKAPRRITAPDPGLRRFGCPTTLPLRWMPNRMRADVLALQAIFQKRPLASFGYGAAVVAMMVLTTYMVIGGSTPPDRLALETVTGVHDPDTFQ